MGGGLIQLIAVGEQDQFLTGNPQITFFKSAYKRHSNFAMEVKNQIFSGGVSFGSLNSCVILKDGDLMSDIILNVKLGSLNKKSNNNVCVKDLNMKCPCNKCNKTTYFSWVNSIGHALVEYVELEIGGYQIDKQYGEWFEIWSELTQNYEKRYGYNELIGKKEAAGFNVNSFDDSLDLLIPMNFWFCKNIGLAIPCIAITNHDIKFNVKWRPFDQLWISNNKNAEPIMPNFEASLLIDFIYLDLNERKKFSSKNHLYLIEQIQSNGDYYFSKSNKNPIIKLNFFHPVKEIVWAIQRADTLIRSTSDDDDDFTFGNDWFNYSNTKNFSSAGVVDIFDTALLQFNGTDRMTALPAKYFRLYQPYKYHTKCPNNFVYTYSFSLRPEEIQPSGTCNFSCFDNARLMLNMKNKEIKSDYIIKIYAINYNLLVITKGMVGLGFSC
jgi:hypothetical protein